MAFFASQVATTVAAIERAADRAKIHTKCQHIKGCTPGLQALCLITAWDGINFWLAARHCAAWIAIWRALQTQFVCRGPPMLGFV